MTSQKVLIVGGVAGGASAAARLRRLDEQAQIVLFERGEYISFANCGLPYYIGGEITDKDDLTLQTPDSFRARFNVDVRVQNEVTAINRANKTVTVLNAETGRNLYRRATTSSSFPWARSPWCRRSRASKTTGCSRFATSPTPTKSRISSTRSTPKPRWWWAAGTSAWRWPKTCTHAGLHVTMVEMLDQVIAPLDFDMAADVHRHIREKGVELLLKTTVKAVREESAEALRGAGQRARCRPTW